MSLKSQADHNITLLTDHYIYYLYHDRIFFNDQCYSFDAVTMLAICVPFLMMMMINGMNDSTRRKLLLRYPLAHSCLLGLRKILDKMALLTENYHH